jgi:hypothetical protein
MIARLCMDPAWTAAGKGEAGREVFGDRVLSTPKVDALDARGYLCSLRRVPAAKKPSFPGTRAVNRFLAQVSEIDRVLHLSIMGFRLIKRTRGLIESLASVDASRLIDISEEDLQRVRDEGSQALREIERGYPALHAHAVVAIWGALEAFVTDVLIAFLRRNRQVLTSGAYAKTKLSLSDFVRLRGDDRYRLVVRELARAQGAELRSGIGKFEPLLEAAGLHGAVPAYVREGLHEMAEARNLIVHRASVVDRRFKERCPQRKLKLGEVLRLTHADYHRCFAYSTTYALCIVNRIQVHSGWPAVELGDEPDPHVCKVGDPEAEADD